MRHPGAQGKDADRGQVSVEFLGTLPAALLVVLVAWQLFVAGQTSWLAANAARVAVRAQVVGRDPETAARSSLPQYLRKQLEVETSGDRSGRVRVRVRVPMLLRRWSSPLRIGATAAMERQ